VIAIAGRPVRLRQAYDAIGDAESLGQAPVSVLRAEHLVKTTGWTLEDLIEPYHDRIRESVSGHLDGRLRGSYHHRLAVVLEGAVDADPETIAAHFDSAGESERAGFHYAQAAATAARTLAFDRAAKLYRLALERHRGPTGDANHFRVQLAHALANGGRGFEAAQEFEIAAAQSTGGDAVELQRQAAMQYCINGRIAQGRRIFAKILGTVGMKLPAGRISIWTSLLLRRGYLRLRGVRFRERPVDSVPTAALQRIDLLWAVSVGLSVPDPIGVATLQTRGLLLALRAGEPYRVARALAIEAYLTATAGWPAAKRSESLLAQANRLATQIDNPHAVGMTRLAVGATALLQARFPDAVAACEQAEVVLREKCTGVWWELSTARTLTAWALWHMGRFRDLDTRTLTYLAEARERGDLYTLTNLSSVALPHLRLAADEPERAQKLIDEAMATWTSDAFHIQHVAAMFTQAHIHLYNGDGAAALKHIDARWAELRRALQLRTQIVRVMMLDLRARSALAAACRAPMAAALLHRAERDARRLARENSNCAPVFARIITAGIEEMRGNHIGAESLLSAASTELGALGLVLRAAAVRRHLGMLLGGTKGSRLIDESNECMGQEQVRNAQRVAAMYVSGRFERC
jgi:tetratricopeptide (TPR) repeat protein